MANPYGAPEITVQELAERLSAHADLIVFDVREMDEFAKVRLQHEKVIELPLTTLARGGAEIMPEPLQDVNREIAVLCHHGIRSAQVTLWMRHKGWKNVVSVAGGIDAYAMLVSPDLGRY